MRIQLKVITSALALAVAAPVVPAAQADGSAFVGGLVGGMLGSAIGNAQRQQQQRPNTVVIREQPRTVVRRAPAPAPVNTYERQQNREVQAALNYFGFPAGTPDGVLGPRSRSAISQFQATVGYPASGYLSEYERAFLLSSYNRAMAGGPQNQAMMAAYGGGPQGLLRAYRAEQQGVPMAAAPTPVAPAPVAPMEPAPVVEAAAPAPEPAPPAIAAAPAPIEAAAPALPALPSFVTETAEASMASQCNRASLVTSTNGGFVTVASMTDPGFALEEQFCLARTYAIEESDRLAAAVQGVTAAEIRAQCEAFAPAMRPYIAMLGGETPGAVEEAVRGFIVQAGMPPAQVAGSARICLGVGYRTDNAELALGSALLLEAAGEAAYGEHVGHHLLQGFGVAKRGDRAVDWLDAAIDAVAAGASPVVAPGAPERVALLRRALDLSTGRGPSEVLSDAAAPAGALPGFALPAAPAGASN